MSEAFLNCGNARLEAAAKTWATRNGFETSPRRARSSAQKWGGNY